MCFSVADSTKKKTQIAANGKEKGDKRRILPLAPIKILRENPKGGDGKGKEREKRPEAPAADENDEKDQRRERDQGG